MIGSGVWEGLAEAVHRVAVTAGGGIGGDGEDFRDAGEGEIFPDFEVNHGTLFLRQAGERLGDGQRRVWSRGGAG